MKKSKNCKVCGRNFYPFNTIDKTCSFVCFQALKEQDEIEVRFQKIKQSLEKSDKVKDLMKIAKLLVQKYARLRDKDLPCISCGTTQSIQWHGSHLMKAELYSGVKLDEININKACKKCNVFMDGNEVGYVQGFIERYGLPAFNDLTKKAKETKTYKWSVPELQEIINKYKLKIKDIM